MGRLMSIFTKDSHGVEIHDLLHGENDKNISVIVDL